ncbi:MAG: RsmB/NOP family class I SAM-dependent RNA methyltransferase, partial [Pseudomonadota bacterium]
RKLPQQKPDFDALTAEDIWPDWFRNILHGQFDEANSAALAQQQLAVPDLHLTAKDGDGAGLAERIGGTWLSGPTAACAAAIVTDLPGFDTGDWWVQDAAAALPAQLLAVQPGDSVVDLCAAPGGKTLQLASLGANVFAIDRSKTRLQRVEENLARTNLLANVTLVASKGEAWTPPGPVDAVLVDAPCSALGTLRRHPEGPWIKRPDEIAGYPNAQKRLLAAAVDMLKPDGRLVYCVCSPLQQEGAEVVEAIIAEHPVSRSPIQPQDVPGFEHTLTADGDLVTLPGGKFAHDAFFISRLVKHA